MSDLSFVVGDNAPSIFGTLTAGGEILNLTAAVAVRFQMRSAYDRRYSLDSAAVVVDAATGAVRYDPAAGDFPLPGDFVCRWQITWNDDTIQHTEPENTITIDPA